MGKGFENYMSKKWFHPTNVENMKRVYNAEQKDAADRKRQAELREQYEREQEIFSNKQLMGDEKARLGLAFMYSAPAGYREKDDSKNKEDEEANQPKYEMKNMRCIKCKRLGHANTDKVCPLYGKSRLDDDANLVKFDETLAKTSRESESSNKKPEEDSKTSKDDEEENDLTLDMLRALPKAEKKALVKRLKKLIKKNKI